MRKLKQTYQVMNPSWQQVVVFVDEEVWSALSSHLELAYLCKIGRCKFIFVNSYDLCKDIQILKTFLLLLGKHDH